VWKRSWLAPNRAPSGHGNGISIHILHFSPTRPVRLKHRFRKPLRSTFSDGTLGPSGKGTGRSVRLVHAPITLCLFAFHPEEGAGPNPYITNFVS
jgi:hypothetical protein